MITINIAQQSLSFKGNSYLISSAKNGVGEQEGSFCTPIGAFKIADKIGTDLQVSAVLVGRVPTGEIYTAELGRQCPDRDWILTRILWLEGLESHNKNTKARYIYIHGTPDEEPMGVVGSKGCIRMHNKDMVALFDVVQVGEKVVIIKQ
ncbi:Glutamate synthase [NADPH] large chain [Bathymodiolus thermophilus thioautotrophic gill symbiont]|uniref:L,D-transpeptidase n=1 Tax=Bathymodiolus thermophilus thioautotrophic gill symbiont TaxID=2360 RepID=UPI0010B05CB1|nr:L,D-transpeptidase [Bathymodiolus thermophilus thioautotrophic gill symbiont]SGZ60776.1 Glutamate synthase [NADPH] large chain [Bathymodiolus thermophilus thioautotrophic gill symbiont]